MNPVLHLVLDTAYQFLPEVLAMSEDSPLPNEPDATYEPPPEAPCAFFQLPDWQKAGKL